jgi:BTB/POZ domain
VENAIFKIHRYFLAKYSPVLRDMFSAPRQDGAMDGTDERPLVLTQDRAVGWELLLDAIYNRFVSPLLLDRLRLIITLLSHILKGARCPSREHTLAMLPIAHKYCMDSVEKAILDHLKRANTTETYVDLMVASQIVNSKPLYQEAVQGLISSKPKLNLSQAKLIGIEAHYAIMEGTLSNADNATSIANSELKKARTDLGNVDNRKCRYCDVKTNWKCGSERCGRSQGKVWG